MNICSPIIRLLLVGLALVQPLQALTIQISYEFDTNNFFDPGTADGAAARAALAAAANRYSEIITTPLSAVNSTNSGLGAVPATDPDWRIGFAHPGTGAPFEISAAPSAAEDDLVDAGSAPADRYDPNFGIPADTWLLFAGGQALDVAGRGGTGTGTNFNPSLPDFPGVFLESGSVLNRGWKGTGGTYSKESLPVWGGYVSFDNDGSTDWHYDHTTLRSGTEADFYSVAIHEIGHALGLNINQSEFTDLISGGQFKGAGAIAALDADNGTSGSTGINLVGGTDLHWEDGTYQSFPFDDGSAPAVGADGKILQDLVLEPTANFSASERRFDLTNVEVAALKDIGWEVIPEPSSTCLTLLGFGLLARRRRIAVS